ncbi:MAG: hypothetical protein ACM3NN_04360 [Nitrospirota bacterium]
MSALRLQADGICGGEEFDLPAMRTLFYSVCTEAWSEAADGRRTACAGDVRVYFWKARGFLEAADQFGHRVFRM